MMMTSSKQIVEQVVSQGHVERTLLAPFICLSASEVEGLAYQAFLHNPTKFSNGMKDMHKTLGLDLIVLETGSLIELEAFQLDLDWSSFPPTIRKGLKKIEVLPANLTQAGRIPILVDTIQRLKTIFANQVPLAVALHGPQRLVSLTKGKLSLDTAGALLLDMVRLFCNSGIDVIWLMEDGQQAPEVHDDWLAVTAPLWGTIQFYQALPSLHLLGAADPWSSFLEELPECVVPCIDPLLAPQLANYLYEHKIYGVIHQPGEDLPDSFKHFAQGKNCLFITSDQDWVGRISIQELWSEVERLKKLVNK